VQVVVHESYPGELADDLANGARKLTTAVDECAHAVLAKAAKMPADGEVHALRELSDLYAATYSRQVPAMMKAAVKAVKDSA